MIKMYVGLVRLELTPLRTQSLHAVMALSRIHKQTWNERKILRLIETSMKEMTLNPRQSPKSPPSEEK